MNAAAEAFALLARARTIQAHRDHLRTTGISTEEANHLLAPADRELLAVAEGR